MKVTAGISINAEIHRKAKLKAREQNRSFSNYVENLVLKDCGEVVLSPVSTVPLKKKQLHRRRKK
jgi:hypothetical protein